MDSDPITTTAAVYDGAAAQYAVRVGTELSDEFETGFDRSILSAAVERFHRHDGPVLDLGCGPGRVAATLHEAALDVVGVDVSRSMLAVARRAHPSLRFEHGSLTDIPVPTGYAAGIVCWYSIIHTAPVDLEAAFVEMHRACRLGAHILLAFQAGEGERVDRPNAYGAGQVLTSYRHGIHDVRRRLHASGFEVRAHAVREPELEHETTPQAFVIARTESTSRRP